MTLHVVADSSCDLFDGAFSDQGIDLVTVPFSMRVGDVEYLDDQNLDVDEFVEAMGACAEAGSSSCPSPHVWAEQFRRFTEVIAVTISCNLSGSYSSAEVGRDLALQDNPAAKIELLDCHATGPAALIAIREMAKWASEGICFDEIYQRAVQMISETKTVFALCSFDNLVKNGRVSKLAGLMAGLLNMWGVGIEKDGAIAMKTKVKGKNRMLKAIVEDMVERGFTGKRVGITHCQSGELAEKLRDLILERFPGAEVFVGPTRGLDSFYAESGGLIVSFC